MANRCAGLDPTWAHLPTPAPTQAAAAAGHYYCSSPSWLTSAAAYENEALTSALRASMEPTAYAYTAAAAAASSFSCPATPSSSTTTSSASELLSASSGGHDAPAASRRPGARAQLAGGPRGGRVAKQRKPRPSRASRRPQTTYITADPANFRRMVQEITGLPVVSGPSSSSFPGCSFPAAASEPALPNWTTPAPACVLPTLDTSAFLLDRAATTAVVPATEDKKSHASLAVTDADAAVAAAAALDDGSSALLELEALVCAAADGCGFPTLDSWEMMI